MRGVEFHVLFQTFESTHESDEELIDAFKKGYLLTFMGSQDIFERDNHPDSWGN